MPAVSNAFRESCARLSFLPGINGAERRGLFVYWGYASLYKLQKGVLLVAPCALCRRLLFLLWHGQVHLQVCALDRVWNGPFRKA